MRFPVPESKRATPLTRLACALLLGAQLVAPGAQAAMDFESAFCLLEAGRDPLGVAVGDFDGDGQADLAAANQSSNNVSVFLGMSGGEFAPRADYPLGGSSPRSVAAGDLNGDGRPDLVVSNHFSNNVSVLLGTGGGGFGGASIYPTGSSPYAVVCVDVSGDGQLDVVTVNATGSISVMLGTGGGTLGAHADYSAVSNGRALAIADVNLDGRPDVAAAGFNNPNVALLLGSGGGVFAAPVSITMGPNSTSGGVALADLNSDGRPDLATASGGATLSVRLGNGDGTFASQTNLAIAGAASGFAVRDLDRDGRLDLVAAAFPGLSVRLGDGSGTFGPLIVSALGAMLGPVAIADLTGDGIPDVAGGTSGTGAPVVAIAVGNGDGSFGSGRRYQTAQQSVFTLALGDFDADGRQDLVATNFTSGSLSLFRSLGGGTFASPTSVVIGAEAHGVDVADFNLDDRADLVVSCSGPHRISILLGNGDGTFMSPVPYATVDDARGLTVADFNRDGRPDVAVADYSTSAAGSISIFLGNGDGTLGPLTSYTTGLGTWVVRAADLNGDENVDLCAVNRTSNNISIFLGSGDGTFVAGQAVVLGNDPYSVAVGDLNGDGRPDLAVPNYTFTNTVAVVLGNGDGTFGPRTDYPAGVSPTSIVIGDFDRNGTPDLAVAVEGYAAVMVLPGNGDGTFGSRESFGGYGAPKWILSHDLDGDGWLDLILANRGPDNVATLLNRQFLLAVGDPRPVSATPWLRGFPNPSHDEVRIEFTLSSGGPVRLRLFDAAGRLVSTLVDDEHPAGTHVVSWHPRSASESRFAPGLYFYELRANGAVGVGRVVVLE